MSSPHKRKKVKCTAGLPNGYIPHATLVLTLMHILHDSNCMQCISSTQTSTNVNQLGSVVTGTVNVHTIYVHTHTHNHFTALYPGPPG